MQANERNERDKLGLREALSGFVHTLGTSSGFQVSYRVLSCCSESSSVVSYSCQMSEGAGAQGASTR